MKEASRRTPTNRRTVRHVRRIVPIASLLLLLATTVPVAPALGHEDSAPQAWEQTDRLVPGEADGTFSGEFGHDVALDEGTLAVGAPFDGGDGAVYVYERSDGAWGEPIRLVPDPPVDAEDATFGEAVALDGDRLIVGDNQDPSGGQNEQGGAFYVFEHRSGAWTQTDAVAPPASFTQDRSEFGSTVALDGDTVVLGAPGQDTADGDNVGAALVYEVDANGAASFLEALTPADAQEDDEFGVDVDVDGQTLLVGAHLGDAPDTDDAGAAYLFEEDGGTWVEDGKLTAQAPTAGGLFGSSVALDGTRALVTSTSAGYVFEDLEGQPVQTAALVDDDLEDELTNLDDAALDGNRLTVTSISAGFDRLGKAFVFEKVDGTWTRTAEVTEAAAPQDGTPAALAPQHLDRFGASVALEGDTVVAGADFHDSFEAGRDGGAAFVFEPCHPDGVVSGAIDDVVAAIPDDGARDELREANCQWLEQAP